MTRPNIYVLDVLAPCEFVNANDRMGWAKKAKFVAQWRDAAGWSARVARLPRITEHVHIVATVHKLHGRTYDATNWAPTAKACVDGLRDARVLVDDSNAYVTGPDMRPGERASEKAFLRLIITPIHGEESPVEAIR